MTSLRLVYGYRLEVSRVHEMADCDCGDMYQCWRFAHYIGNLQTLYGVSTYPTKDDLIIVCGAAYLDIDGKTDYSAEVPDVTVEIKATVHRWGRDNGIRNAKKYILVNVL